MQLQLLFPLQNHFTLPFKPLFYFSNYVTLLQPMHGLFMPPITIALKEHNRLK